MPPPCRRWGFLCGAIGARRDLLFRQKPSLDYVGAVLDHAAQLDKWRSNALRSFTLNGPNGNAARGGVVGFRDKVLNVHFWPH